MTPNAEKPSGDLDKAIISAFGDVANLKTKFVEEGAGHFGSGWVWLVADKNGKLEIRSTHDAEDLVTHEGVTPLLVCDLWGAPIWTTRTTARRSWKPGLTPCRTGRSPPSNMPPRAVRASLATPPRPRPPTPAPRLADPRFSTRSDRRERAEHPDQQGPTLPFRCENAARPCALKHIEERRHRLLRWRR